MTPTRPSLLALLAVIADPEVKALFDELEAPDAKRMVTAKKYNGDKAKIVEVLTVAIADVKKAAAKTAEASAPATPSAA